MVDLSLILPVHNEATIITDVLADVIRTLKSIRVPFECILVENGSTDSTLTVLRQLTKKYSNVYVTIAPKGYGSAVLAGLKNAKGRYVCYMPSDGQIDLNVFSSLWKSATLNKWDLVKIRRVTRESWDRSAISTFFSIVVSMLFGIPRWDINGSPHIFLRSHLQKLNLESKDSFIDTEFAVKAHLLGWNIKEIPMRTLPRTGGISTRSWRTFWEFARNLFWFRFYRFPILRKKLRLHR